MLSLPVPVEKVPVGPGAITFKHEDRLVAVVAVSRNAGGPGRWHYIAHYHHPDAHPEYPRIGFNGALTHWIRRASHPQWKPPVFPGDKSGTVVIEQKEATK